MTPRHLLTIAAVLLLVAVAGGLWLSTNDTPGNPSAPHSTSNSPAVDLEAALSDRTALIYVWSPDFDGCRRELTVLDEYTKSAGAVPMIGVQVHGDAVEGLRLRTDLSARLPTVLDEGAVSNALQPRPTALPAIS